MSSAVDIKNSTADILATMQTNNAIGKQAAEAFQKSGLPAAKHEEYKYAPITRTLEKNFDFSINKNKTSSIADISSFMIKNLDAHVIALVNGEFSEQLSSFDNKEIHLEILSQNQWPEKLGTLADFNVDALVAWNTASWTQCIRITVSENQEIDKPVIIHHITDTSNGQIKSINRILIEVGKNSKLSVIEKQDSIAAEHSGFSSIVSEAFIQENAELNYYSIQADEGNRFHFGQTSIWQARSSRVNSFLLTISGKFIRNNLQLILDGEGSESHLHGLYLIGGETLVDNHTVVDHKKANTYSNELYKGVIDESAKGIFNGKIFVRPHAQKTNAFQTNRNILLTDKATVNTKPQLEIWADDVKCSHGCTTGQLDEDALFYLQSRGISKETAQAMVLYAFAAEVIESVKSDVLKNYFDELISERLHKNF